MEYQKSGPGLACNLDFAKKKGLEQKLKSFQNCLSWETWWANLSNPNLSQTVVCEGQAARQFFVIFWEKSSYFNTIWNIFFTFLEPFKITEFLRFESQSKGSNWWVYSLLTDQVQNTFKSRIWGVKFCKWLGPCGRSKVPTLSSVIFLAVNNRSSTYFGDFCFVMKITGLGVHVGLGGPCPLKWNWIICSISIFLS